jgi:hypothetical protein
MLTRLSPSDASPSALALCRRPPPTLGVVELPGSLLWTPDGSLVNCALRVAAARRAPSLIERTGG